MKEIICVVGIPRRIRVKDRTKGVSRGVKMVVKNSLSATALSFAGEVSSDKREVELRSSPEWSCAHGVSCFLVSKEG